MVVKGVEIAELCYELYKKDWLDNNVTPDIISDSIKDYYKGRSCGDIDADMTYADYIFENGYGNGTIYVCFDEFVMCEYQDEEYMKSLLGDTDLINEYEKDVAQFSNEKPSKSDSKQADEVER